MSDKVYPDVPKGPTWTDVLHTGKWIDPPELPDETKRPPKKPRPATEKVKREIGYED